MIIVGLSGEIGSGKTTLADFLAAQSLQAGHWESWQVIAEVADRLRTSGMPYPTAEDLDLINAWLQPLPKAVKEVAHRDIPYGTLHLTAERASENPEHYEKLFTHLHQVVSQPKLAHGEITAENKEAFRPLLQWLGGYLIEKSDEGLWYDEILRRIARQPSLELATIGGVRFPGEARRIKAAHGWVVRIVRPDQARRDATDLTERKNEQIPVDCTVINNGTLLQLQACAKQLFKDLEKGHPEPNYTAANA